MRESGNAGRARWEEEGCPLEGGRPDDFAHALSSKVHSRRLRTAVFPASVRVLCLCSLWRQLTHPNPKLSTTHHSITHTTPRMCPPPPCSKAVLKSCSLPPLLRCCLELPTASSTSHDRQRCVAYITQIVTSLLTCSHEAMRPGMTAPPSMLPLPPLPHPHPHPPPTPTPLTYTSHLLATHNTHLHPNTNNAMKI